MSLDVFHVDGERGLRGGERQLLYLAGALRARGHRNTVVCRRGSPLSLEAERLGHPRLELPFAGEWDPYTAFALRRAAAKAERPVLHAHTAHAAAVAALASAWSGPPFVVHRRVDFALSGALSRRVKYAPARRVIAVSGAIAALLRRAGLPDEKLAVVADGFPVDEDECGWAGVAPGLWRRPTADERRKARQKLAAEFPIDPAAPWIGNLAALVPHKDHDNLLAAALLVLMKRKDAVFLIGGEGPEEDRLLGSVKRMGLLGKVLLVGQRRDPADFLKALDVFVLSSWGEGMGSVLLEAAACGVPIAATSAGGIPEVVSHDESGLLAPPRDPEALAANILSLLEDPVLGGRLAAEASAGLPRFGLRRMAEQVEACYA